MPEMSPFGWFHTIMGIVALLSGGYSIIKYKIIESSLDYVIRSSNWFRMC